MLTAEKIARHYRGPHHRPGSLEWTWYQKGRRWPRVQFMLFFNDYTRIFHLHKGVRHSPKNAIYYSNATVLKDDRLASEFRSLLTPEDVAFLTAAAFNPRTRERWINE